MVMIKKEFVPDSLREDADFEAEYQRLTACTQVRNHTPDPEMGNLSPAQVARVAYGSWGSHGHPIQLNTSLTTEALSTSPFFLQAQGLLRALRDRDGVKATATKNLPRQFVAEMMDALLPPELCCRIRRFKKTPNETDAWQLHLVRVVAETAGSMRLRRGVFAVPKTALPLLTDAKAGELFGKLFTAHFQTVNLAYAVGYGPEAASIQFCAPYALHRLSVIADRWQPIGTLAKAILLPFAFQELTQEIGTSARWTVIELLLAHLIHPWVDWGLLEAQRVTDERLHISETVAIRTTPLFRSFLRIRLD